ncbi:MAG: phosphotransferase [Phycisphaera sp.]|nr:phosphotransferase [Phycisphaera sp.]
MAVQQPDRVEIDTATATRLVYDYLDPRIGVTAIKELSRATFRSVALWTVTAQPGEIIAKIHLQQEEPTLRREFATLSWFSKNSLLPVPQPHAFIYGSPAFRGTVLLMEKAPGRALDKKRLTPAGWKLVQIDLARHLANLHDIHREQFGHALEPARYDRWLDKFGPNFEMVFHAVREKLSTRTRAVMANVIRHLDTLIPSNSKPTLVHGELLPQNIFIDDHDPDEPAITAFLGCGAYFYDAEYELAHLRLFETVDETFFNTYEKRHPPRPGFERRCLIYWMHTLMHHTHRFGDSHLPACEQVAQRLETYL